MKKFKMDAKLWLAILIAMIAAIIITCIAYLLHLAFGFGGVFTVLWVMLIPVVQGLIKIYIDTNCFDIEDLIMELLEDEENEEVSANCSLDD